MKGTLNELESFFMALFFLYIKKLVIKNCPKNLKVILNGEKVKIETQDNKVKKYKIDVNKTDLSCLSERQRQVVLLVHGEGLSFAETGRRLGITRSNAYSTMRDVYKKLEKNS